MKKFLQSVVMMSLLLTTTAHADKEKYLIIHNMSNTFLYFTVVNMLNVEVKSTGHTTDIRYLPPKERKMVKIKIKGEEGAVQIFAFTANGLPDNKENLVPICEVSAAQKDDLSSPFADANVLPDYDSTLQCKVKDKLALVING